MAAKYTLAQELEVLEQVNAEIKVLELPLTVLQLKHKGNIPHSIDVIGRICKKYSINNIIYGKEAISINRKNAALCNKKSVIINKGEII